jgi:hypothetical protein
MPSSSPVGFVSYCYASTAPPTAYNGHSILQMGVPSQSASIDHNIGAVGHVLDASTKKPMVVLIVTGTNSSTTFFARGQSVPYDGKPHNVILSWDASRSLAHILIDGVSRSVGRSKVGSAQSIDYAGRPVWVGGILKDSRVFCGFPGMLADLYVLAGSTMINPSRVVSGFYNIKTGHPVRNVGDGSSAIHGMRPQIFLSGGAILFPQNRTARTWTWNGAYNDALPPSAFYTVAGTLQTAAEDPFESGSPT